MCRFCCHAFEKCGNEFERKRVFFSLCYWKMGQKIKESESYWVINIRDNNLMSSLQKYTRTKKKNSQLHHYSRSILVGGGNQYCWKQSERTNHTFYRRMVCATHRCYKKRCEIYQVYSWNSDLILFVVSAVSSESRGNLPWWQSVCVEKSVNVHLVVEAFFPPQCIVFAAAFSLFSNCKIPHGLKQNTKLLPVYLMEKTWVRLEMCNMTLHPLELVYKPNAKLFSQGWQF